MLVERPYPDPISGDICNIAWRDMRALNLLVREHMCSYRHVGVKEVLSEHRLKRISLHVGKRRTAESAIARNKQKELFAIRRLTIEKDNCYYSSKYYLLY